ncbi:MAG: hypothetical protein LBQ22_06235 [Bacteroidales bacterium]|jgi:D-3-phosphoglycerate dehydrogenase|nr:hypothetical protein [Bacteroidales bacterium]
MPDKILLIDTVHEIIPRELEKHGFEIVSGTEWSRNLILQKIHDFTGIIIRSRITVDKEIIDAAKKMKFIGRVGAGMESIDTEYCEKKGIICLNSPEGNKDAVGEHAIGMLLSLLNNLNKADKEVKSGLWLREANRGIELNNKTVGIIGYGNMGSSFAKKLSGFGCNIISYDKYKSDYSDGFTKEVSLEEIFENSDILSLHVPLTDETTYMVDEKFIEKFKKPFFLINTARGPVVKTSALVNGLKNKKVLGAGLDVVEYEEASFETSGKMTEDKDFKYLSGCDNVIMSPHIAGWTFESKIKLAEILVKKIINIKNKQYDK